jgi:hypothetical protein
MASFVEGSRKTHKAGVDLSTVGQYLAVKLSATGVVVLAAAPTDVVIGICMTKGAKLNDSVDVFMRSGGVTVKAQAGGTIAINDAVTSNASGQLITTTTAGNQIVGYAQEPAVAGQIFEIMPSLAKY